ncbi:type II toxin-antitoxin system RelE/ParE family toxin [Nocardia sp. NPDC005366]|uniref:type II toxin-antitoxin system RelE/ParE family toxin n=1 Tax=Nocardia sp. NPDC005366 TaxID=3156878 RepID=UPI0033B9FCB3
MGPTPSSKLLTGQRSRRPYGRHRWLSSCRWSSALRACRNRRDRDCRRFRACRGRPQEEAGCCRHASRHFLEIDGFVGLLAEEAEPLGEPYARYLADGVRELRPTPDGAAIRITYRLAPMRRAIPLTVFRKTRMREDAKSAAPHRNQHFPA